MKGFDRSVRGHHGPDRGCPLSSCHEGPHPQSSVMRFNHTPRDCPGSPTNYAAPSADSEGVGPMGSSVVLDTTNPSADRRRARRPCLSVGRLLDWGTHYTLARRAFAVDLARLIRAARLPRMATLPARFAWLVPLESDQSLEWLSGRLTETVASSPHREVPLRGFP